jgi:VWFA-related protein
MPRRWCTFSFLVASLVLAGVLASSGLDALGTPPPQGTAGPPSAQQRPTFATATILVPVDVRVIDNKTHKPVVDLQQDDFTLFEDGVAQPIRHFEHRRLTPEAPPAPGARPPVRESTFGITPQNNRVFLIVLGRGRLQEPSKALDALQRFVREQLLPQDQVAVFAYDRATDFTTDHEQVAQLIERFKRAHEQIDMEVRLAIESSMAAVYGSRSIPRSLQAKIDAVFQGAGAPGYREIGKGETTASQRAEKDVNRQLDRSQQADAVKTAQQLYDDAARNLGGTDAGLPPNIAWTTLDEVASRTFTTLGLDDFMAHTAQSLQDLGNCYAGIQYLRHLEGDKHLVFVTERGMNLPRLEDDLDLARAANDARVAIHTFQVGGLEGQQGGVWTDQTQQTFAFRALRVIAEQTGGLSSISENGLVAVSRINEASKTEYLLGYYPSTVRLDGGYREIEVKVKRPDVTVLYRRGYFSTPVVGSFNRRDFITQDRLRAAVGFRREIKDIKLDLHASVQRSSSAPEVTVNLAIDPSKLALSVIDGTHAGSIDVLVACFDDRGALLSQHYQRADVKLTEENFKRALKSGLPYTVRFETNPGVRRVRVVVYDYRADLIGSADVQVL